MTFAYLAYQGVTGLASPFLPILLDKRVKAGKEDPGRLSERRGYASRKRPAGKLIWLHGASIGESQVLLLLFEALREADPDISAIITTQTLTSARMIAAKGLPGLVHQMAPVDTPFATERFLKHWQPDLAVFAEGDIWPNMIMKLDRKRIPRLLVNARMTDKSFDGWMRYKALARKIFAGFQTILAANIRTSDYLKQFSPKRVKFTGNIKYAAPPLPADEDELAKLKGVIGARPVLSALSTHEGEEALVLDAYDTLKKTLPELVLILAPRHPDRGDDLEALLSGRSVYRRSTDVGLKQDQDTWLCDTLGELGLWIRLGSVIYLGGGLEGSGVGGHNPLEPLKLDRFTFYSPEVNNFAQEFSIIHRARGADPVTSSGMLAELALPFLTGEKNFSPDESLLGDLLYGEAPLHAARDAVLGALAGKRAR